jgi:hypothetical protein
VQDYVEEAAVYCQSAVIVINEAKLSKFVHEMTDPRSRGPYHLSQRILVDPWNYGFGPAFLPEMSQQQENPGQAFLARIEKLVDKVRFVSDVAGKQMPDKQFRDIMLFAKYARHQRFLNLVESAIRHGDGRSHARLLTREASLTKELAGAQNGNDCLLALLGNYLEFHFASTDVEQAIRGLPLPEDGAVHSAFHYGLPAENAGQDHVPIHRFDFLSRHFNLSWLAETKPQGQE